MLSSTKYVSPTNLRRVPVVRPDRAGPQWKGVKHSALIDGLVEECEARKWTVPAGGIRIVVSKDKADMVAAIDVLSHGSVGRQAPMPVGFCFTIGVMSSNAWRWGLKLIAGATFVQGGWGVATAEVSNRRWQHKEGLDLSEATAGLVAGWEDEAANVGRKIKDMKEFAITTEAKDHLLLEAFRGGVLHSPPWEKIGKVDAEWNKAMADGQEPTEFTLYSCFAKVVMKDKPGRQFHALLRFYRLLSKTLTTAG